MFCLLFRFHLIFIPSPHRSQLRWPASFFLSFFQPQTMHGSGALWPWREPTELDGGGLIRMPLGCLPNLWGVPGTSNWSEDPAVGQGLARENIYPVWPGNTWGSHRRGNAGFSPLLLQSNRTLVEANGRVLLPYRRLCSHKVWLIDNLVFRTPSSRMQSGKKRPREILRRQMFRLHIHWWRRLEYNEHNLPAHLRVLTRRVSLH